MRVAALAWCVALAGAAHADTTTAADPLAAERKVVDAWLAAHHATATQLRFAFPAPNRLRVTFVEELGAAGRKERRLQRLLLQPGDGPWKIVGEEMPSAVSPHAAELSFVFGRYVVLGDAANANWATGAPVPEDSGSCRR